MHPLFLVIIAISSVLCALLLISVIRAMAFKPKHKAPFSFDDISHIEIDAANALS